MGEKKRLDLILTDRGFFNSRQISRTNIMCGNVLVDGIKVFKPGEKLDENVKIEIIGKKENLYVSRAGVKLKKAIDEFGIDLKNKICFDIGASTGGFTDCMLKEGASKIFAIDVGYGQLDYRLRVDERVVVLERTNVRYVDEDFFDVKGEFSCIDVSFISLEKILGKVRSFLKSDGEIVALIKPQFEARKGKVNKKGIVKDKEIHFEVIDKILNFLRLNKFGILGLSYSPIRGGNGNIEFLVHLSVGSKNDFIDENYIWNIVELSHKNQNFS